MTPQVIALIIVMYIPAMGVAQDLCTAKFSGNVVDNDGKSLIGATVVLTPGQAGTVSNKDGYFQFAGLCAGAYTVTVNYLGYTTKRFEITLTENRVEKISLDIAVETLKEVIVEVEQTHVENAQNFSVLSGKQLATTAGKTLGEALKEIPGVSTIQAGPGIFKPVIHGVNSQRILTLNHGIRQEGQQWGAEHAPEIDPFIASNIIVIKDASSLKYGTDALGGVVIVNPPALPENPGIGGAFNMIGQSNGRSGTFSGMVEGGIRGMQGWGWRLQGTAKRAGDFHAPDYSLTNTGVKELNFSAATGYHKENKGFDLFFSRFDTELGILKGTSISNLDDLLTALEREPPQFTEDFSYTIGEPRQAVSHNLLKLNGHLTTAGGEWRVQYGFQNNNRQEFDIRRGSLSGIPSIDLELNSHTLEVERVLGTKDSRSISLGINGMAQQNSNIPGTQRIPFIPNFTSYSGGVFAVGKFVLDRLVIDAGMRYDYRYYTVSGFDFKNTLFNDQLDFQNVSATVGATLQARANQTWTMNLSTAWRPPHVAELYSLGTHQSAAAIEFGLLLDEQTNEVLDFNSVPFGIERAVKGVTAYQRRWGNSFVELTGYANYIFNYIYLRPRGITQTLRGVFPFFRYAQTDALFLGADLNGEWAINPHWIASGRASLLRASDEENDDFLMFIPSNRLDIALRFEEDSRFALKDFYAEARLKYVARQGRAPRVVTVREIKEADEQNIELFTDERNFDFLPAPSGYALVNLSSGFSIRSGGLKYDFRVAAENLLNTSYREYTNRFRYYADDLGRNFLLSVKITF